MPLSSATGVSSPIRASAPRRPPRHAQMEREGAPAPQRARRSAAPHRTDSRRRPRSAPLFRRPPWRRRTAHRRWPRGHHRRRASRGARRISATPATGSRCSNRSAVRGRRCWHPGRCSCRPDPPPRGRRPDSPAGRTGAPHVGREGRGEGVEGERFEPVTEGGRTEDGDGLLQRVHVLDDRAEFRPLRRAQARQVFVAGERAVAWP